MLSSEYVQLKQYADGLISVFGGTDEKKISKIKYIQFIKNQHFQMSYCF